ncbi:XS domain containing protein-like [Oryza sativa Japonica Group]|uniref:XS domain containing protein-like n=1 Tax=Oryza sativa subsp. japonica TaxID=39947 RepID=Q5JK13_ORYSJ|nr:XS domain containing protein-like [Oryza sativa Japonica Group]BAD88187.1 XS domain containing protein-like [Oryza sativa Japonica Group]
MGHTYLHSAGSRCNVGAWLSADDVTGVSPVTDRSFFSTTRQFSMPHICPSSYSDFLAMVAMKPGMNRAGTDVLTPGVTTPAPARDECQEALIIPTGRGEACDKPPAAT